MSIVVSINKRVVRAVTVLTYTLLLLSVMTKLLCIGYISDKFQTLGIHHLCRLLGTLELIAVILFYFNKTFNIGLILLVAYFGGAIATDLQAPQYLYQPAVLLGLVIFTGLFHRPIIFMNELKLVDQGKRLTLTFHSRT